MRGGPGPRAPPNRGIASASGRLREHEDFEELMLLRACDSAGRRGGVVVCSVDEALEFVRGMEEGWAG